MGNTRRLSMRNPVMPGSSPRAWGTLLFPEHQMAITTVHPHGRGEHADVRAAVDGDVRFIPTGVGNTSGPNCRIEPAAVHPHGRGEHPSRCLFHGSAYGSSPRAWGTPLLHTVYVEIGRFIPTGVGNTSQRPTRSTLPPVHPHARGEHSRVGQGFSASVRFIPTHVGNTCLPPADQDL
ncbi:hypothetical protein CV_1384 [Chromobacterium violaceum ATCC 12472]|nr:hypothetical protein CV_1384 [Chromobacterium violaceum ATCC 12472]